MQACGQAAFRLGTAAMLFECKSFFVAFQWIRVAGGFSGLMVRFLMVLAFSACGFSQVQYLDAEEESTTTDFGIVDFRKVTEELVQKLTADAYLKTEFMGLVPVLLILPMRNLTDEYIDTRALTQAIRVDLARSRMFSFVSRDSLDVLAAEMALEQSGLADSASTVRMGRLVGAQYVLDSELSNIRSITGRASQQIYYRVTMVLIDIETGTEIWIEEAELSKWAGYQY